jgi:hypothetical protein
MFRLAVITVFASAIAFAQPRGVNKSLSQSTPTRTWIPLQQPGFTVPLCTGFPHSHSPVLVVQGSSIHVRMPAKPVRR